MSTDTLFNPIDNTLEQRVSAAKGVMESLKLVEVSLHDAQSDDLGGVYGTQDELNAAHALIHSSLNDAANALSIHELQQSFSDNQLSKQEYNQLSMTKTRLQLQDDKQNQLHHVNDQPLERDR